jgi:hypothetical protein
MTSLLQGFCRSLGFAALLVACGCGPGEVAGTATLNGKPIVSGSVIILASNSMTYTGQLDENGGYRIEKVPRGAAQVAIASPNPSALYVKGGPKDANNRFKPAAAVTPAQAPAAPPPKWFPVPTQFAEFETSGLRLTVGGGVNTFDIPLTEAPKR